MTLHLYPDLEQGTEEWHAIRRGIVTASTIGRLITTRTLKPASNDTSRALTEQLVAERITGETEPTFMNDDMMRGVLHEPIARDTYAEHNDVQVEQIGFMIRDDWGFPIGASPDGLIGDNGGLEIKCPRAKAHIRTILTDQVPAQYMAQVQTSLLVSGRDWWDFVSFRAGLPMWTKRVYPDPKWQDAIVAAATAFEEAADETVATYERLIVGLPATEPVPDLYAEIQV